MQPQVYLLNESQTENRVLAATFTISLACHLIFFMILIWGPGHMPRKRYLPTVVNVNLVSLPAPAASGPKGPSGASANKKIAKPATAEPAVTPSQKKAVTTAPREWKAKTSLKKKTYKPAKIVKSAIKRIEKTAEEARPDPLKAALDRLKDKVEQKEVTGNATPETGKEAGGGVQKIEGTGSAGGGRPGGSSILTSEILVYQQEISYHIRNNWVFSQELAGSQADLEARLMIKIVASGEIKDVWFEQRSGNRYLDESAYKAVMKSNPLPALPKGYEMYNVGLIFTPTGLK